MPRAKISEFSTTAGDNTDIDGINIGEGCAPSGINDAIRELMAQLKDFQSGAAGDNITVVGTLAAKGTSSSGADLKLYEDTDNGTNYVGFIAPASIASNVQWTLPSADGSSGQALQTNGSGTLSFATLGISAGGTGQTTANAAFNALAPSQTSNAGRYLKTDGTNTSWDLLDISTADITGTLPVANGGTGITSFGTGVATALGINVGSSGAFVTNGGALGTPSSGTVTNLTGTASININGTVGGTTPNTGSFTTLTTSSTVTINGGTANGVAYLNGSKVLTTGSALTFDGTTLENTGKLLLRTSSAPTLAGQYGYDSGAGTYIWSKSGSGANFTLYNNTGYNAYTIDTSGTHIWAIGSGSEQMRLTSTGLGIGTSSPAYLQHNYSATENATALALSTISNSSTAGSLGLATKFRIGAFGSANNNGVAEIRGLHNLYNDALSAMSFWTNNGSSLGERMRLDSSGNLGLGVTPAFKLDISGGGSTAKINTLDTYDGGASISTWQKVGRRAGTGNNAYINTVHSGSDAVSALTWAFGTSSTGTETLRLAGADGTLILKGGSTSATGTGITFPATQSASSDANTLDDYEEGTWTPVLGGSGGTSGQTYSKQSGRYTKIGRQVICNFEVTLTAVGTVTTYAVISGFPFTSAGTSTDLDGGGTLITFASGYAANQIYVSGYVISGETRTWITGISAAGTSQGNINATDIWGNSTRIAGVISYTSAT